MVAKDLSKVVAKVLARLFFFSAGGPYDMSRPYDLAPQLFGAWCRRVCSGAKQLAKENRRLELSNVPHVFLTSHPLVSKEMLRIAHFALEDLRRVTSQFIKTFADHHNTKIARAWPGPAANTRACV